MSEVVQNILGVKELFKLNYAKYTRTIALAAEYVALQLLPAPYIPDMIIGGLPVYHIQHEGHAASDELLKYRSMGTIFLAHQKGGRRTFKCTLKIQGLSRLYVLGFLQLLQKTGIQQNIKLGDFASHYLGTELPAALTEPDLPPEANEKIRYLTGENIENEIIGVHRTIPIITDTKIYTNMYLETLRYTEDIRVGVDTMMIDCAFREYNPPLHVAWFKGDSTKKTQKGYFTTWINDEEKEALRRLDFFMNVTWASRAVIRGFVDPTMEHKQRGFYEIEPAILAFGMGLSKLLIGGL